MCHWRILHLIDVSMAMAANRMYRMSLRFGEARGCLVVLSWYWLFCVVVVSCWDIWVTAVVCDCCVVVSSSMIMVPPPWFISWVMRSWDGAWASGDGIGGNVGVCIGRNVMVVVFRWVDIR